MSDQSGKSDVEYARQLQEKFELYLLGLIFTLLALAIQTAEFGASDWADLFELGGWLSLFVSGLFGLSRIEWVPVTLKTHSALIGIKTELQQLTDAEIQGLQQVAVVDQEQPAEIASLISDRKATVGRVEKRLKSLERGIRCKYEIHKWSFVLGLFFLILARSFLPIEALAKKHLTLRSGEPPTATAGFKRYVA